MTTRVFVPVTDDMMETLDGRATPLVPYHPDRPCWRFDAPAPATSTRQAGNDRHPNPADRGGQLAESSRLSSGQEKRYQSAAGGKFT